MKSTTRINAIAALLLILGTGAGCRLGADLKRPADFHGDLAFLKRHVNTVVLGEDATGPRVVVVPEYQGRVMTSTTGGPLAPSHGWINYDLIESGELRPHINAFGGEDRFWLGPEGGQFAIFFKTGDPFDFENWQTPALIDSVAYEVVSQDSRQVHFTHAATIKNYSGTEFELRIDRTIRMLAREQVEEQLGIDDLGDLELVAYESENTLTNRGRQAWTTERGLLSIWILGMFRPTETTTVVIPFRAGPESELGPTVNDAYFGKVPADRLSASEDRLFFQGDGQWRSKIGVSKARARDLLGSYDPSRNLLTLVQYSLPKEAGGYVNSMWELQQEPYGGDVVNSYNDGPLEPGGDQLGPFYELETSSPAAALEPKQSLTHIHRTMHLRGDPKLLDLISRATLGVSLAEIEGAL